MIVVLKLIIGLSLLNVWVIRFDKKSPFRGADSNSMTEEFNAYGLPKVFMYSIGLYKVLFSIFLIFSLFFGSKFDQAVYMGLVFLSFIMVGSIIMHFRVNDPLKKSIPAFAILFLSIFVLLSF